MTVYVGKSGKTYKSVEPFLGKGGEGAVYAIEGIPDYVLKIYLDGKATETKYRKLAAMLDTKMSEAAMRQITWPVDIVYQEGKFAGYVMPQLSGTEVLNVMYSDKYRCSLLEKLTIARNICVAVHSVHEAGQVCGDLNPKNIAVDPVTAKVRLVDTDSYHITDRDAKVYRCEVGLPEYLPREIQEKMKNGDNLATASLPTFSRSSDLFALAVHIFALLMNGCHPYACAISSDPYYVGNLMGGQRSVVAPQPIDNICNGFFPFYQHKNGVTTPKYAPEFSVLPAQIQDLFIKAFVDGHEKPELRPDSATWYKAIAKMQQNLTICQVDRIHMYPNTLWQCPWCMIDQRMKKASPIPIPVPTHRYSSFYPLQNSVSTPYPAAMPFSKNRPFWLRPITAIFFGVAGLFIGIICASFIYIMMLVFSGNGFMSGFNSTWEAWTTVIQTVVVIILTWYGLMLGWKI